MGTNNNDVRICCFNVFVGSPIGPVLSWLLMGNGFATPRLAGSKRLALQKRALAKLSPDILVLNEIYSNVLVEEFRSALPNHECVFQWKTNYRGNLAAFGIYMIAAAIIASFTAPFVTCLTTLLCWVLVGSFVIWYRIRRSALMVFLTNSVFTTNMILWNKEKFNLIEKGVEVFEKQGSDLLDCWTPRGFVYCGLQLKSEEGDTHTQRSKERGGKKRLWVGGFHCSLDTDVTSAHMTQLASTLNKLRSQEDAIVVLGDANAPDDHEGVVGLQTTHGFRDAWALGNNGWMFGCNTWCKRNSSTRGFFLQDDHRDDYIFMRDGACTQLVCARCGLFGDEPVEGVWLSDHFGVVADARLQSKEEGVTGVLATAKLPLVCKEEGVTGVFNSTTAKLPLVASQQGSFH